jgi:hypothetical protein
MPSAAKTSTRAARATGPQLLTVQDLSGSSRCTQRAVLGPSATKPRIKRLPRDAEYAAPLRQGVRLPSKAQTSHGALILALLLHRCPAAIRRFVIAVHVDAVNRMCVRRARPHVGVERGEVSAPSVAHAYTAPTVVAIRLVHDSIASRLHFLPSVVFDRVLKTVGQIRLALSAVAAATARVGSTKAHGSDIYLDAAGAATSPHRVSSRAGGASNHGETSKLLTGEFNKSWHRYVTISQRGGEYA